MRRRRLLASVLALCLGGIAFTGVKVSGATYTGVSGNLTTVTAATDWTPPTVSVTTPANTTLYASATISATAADARGVVASVLLQYAASGSQSFTTVCTDTTAPYSCAWDTTKVTDGSYTLRAVATDDSGYTATSETVTVRVANQFTVTLTDPGDSVRGSVPLSASLQAAPGVSATMRIEYVVTGASNWAVVPGCADQTNTTTRSCTWVTSGSEDYDLRAVAVVGGVTVYDTIVGVTVDNVAPSVVLTVPSGLLRGTVTLSATAADDQSGVDTVAFQYRASTSSTWLGCGTSTASPYSCRLNTTSLTPGLYDFRAVVTDLSGNSATSPTQTRTVDNTLGTVSITSPDTGDVLAGTVTVTADANFVGGITSVRIESRPVGGTFAALCTDTTAPYSCSWATSGSGAFELRAVMTQSVGGTVTSATVPVSVDNTPLKAVDVQGVNGVKAGTVDQGDRLVLTYSSLVDLTTIKAGWTGESAAVAVVAKDAKLSGATIAGLDRFELGSGLGQVATTSNLLSGSKSSGFTGSTMTASTATVGGVPVTVITVTLGTPDSNSAFRTAKSGTLRWAPTASVRSASGIACSTTVASESGSADRDF